MGRYLRNDRFEGFARDASGAVSWNGHTWPKSYQCEPMSEYATERSMRKGHVFLTCGHMARYEHRFCPMCGRAIVGTDVPRKLAALNGRRLRV